MTQLTDLEGAALAEVAARGKATSYLIAQVFANSPSEYWSGSAGAVYPLIKRLAERGLLEPSLAASGKRQRIDYQITGLGLESLENWLLDAKRASGMGFDPLRTRLGHLHLVPEDRRAAFLQEVRKHSEEFAKQPRFEGQLKMVQIHQTWLKARSAWLSMLDFVIK